MNSPTSTRSTLWRKLVSVFMSLVLAIGLMPLPAFAQLTAENFLEAEDLEAQATGTVFYHNSLTTVEKNDITEGSELPKYSDIFGTTKPADYSANTSFFIGWVRTDADGNTTSVEDNFAPSMSRTNQATRNGKVEFTDGEAHYYAAFVAQAPAAGDAMTVKRAAEVNLTSVYRCGVPVSNTSKHYFMARIITSATTVIKGLGASKNGWTLKGWSTDSTYTIQGGDYHESDLSITSENQTQTYLDSLLENHTTLYEVATRPVELVMGPLNGAGIETKIETLTQYYNAATRKYGMDASNIWDYSANTWKGKDWGTPSNPEKEGAAYYEQFLPAGNPMHFYIGGVGKPSEVADKAESVRKFVTKFEWNDETKTGDISSLNTLANTDGFKADTAPQLSAVYSRLLKIRVYKSSTEPGYAATIDSAGGTEGVNYKCITWPQWVAWGTLSKTSAGSAVPNEHIPVTNPWPNSTCDSIYLPGDHGTYDDLTGSVTAFSGSLGMSTLYNGGVLEATGYANNLQIAEAKYTVHFMDGATELGTARPDAGETLTLATGSGGAHTPAKLRSGYSEPGTFVGWALGGNTQNAGESASTVCTNKFTSVPSVGGSSQSKDTGIYLHAIWSRQVDLKSGLDAGTTAQSGAQKFNLQGSGSYEEVTLAAPSGASPGNGWAIDATKWYKSDGTAATTDLKYSGSDATLYAKYERALNVNFANNSTGAHPESVSDLPSATTAGPQTLVAGGTASPVSVNVSSVTSPAKNGRYTFEGWTATDSGNVSSASKTSVSVSPAASAANTVTLYTTWTQGAAAAVNFKVHYKIQKADGSYEESDELKTKSEGDSVRASDYAKTGMTGYKAPSYSDENPITLATGNESQVLFTITYDRVTNAVTLPTLAGVTFSSDPSDVSAVRYGQTVTVTATGVPAGFTVSYTVTKASGGTVSVSKSGNNASFKMPDDNVTIVASVTRPPANYYVEYYTEKLDGNYEKHSGAGPVSGKYVGDTVNVTADNLAKSIEGFTYNSAVTGTVPSVTLTGTQANDTLKLYYTRNSYSVPAAFTADKGNGLGNATFTVSPNGSVKYQTPVTITSTLSADKFDVSFTLNGVPTGTTFTVPTANVDLAATITPKPVSYTIEKYFMDFEGNYPAEASETDASKKEQVGKTVTLAHDTIAVPGFTVSDSGTYTSVTSGTVPEDGTLTLKIYYKRNVHTLAPTEITVQDDDKVVTRTYVVKPTKSTGLDANQAYFGDTVEIALKEGEAALPANLAPTFSATGVQIATDMEAGKGSFTMPDAGVTEIAGTLQAKVDYTVEHWVQGLDGKYTKKDTETLKGIVTTTVTATPKSYDGCVLNPAAAGSKPSDVVAKTGTVLKLYYDLVKSKVTISQASFTAGKATVKFEGKAGAAVSTGLTAVAVGDTVTISTTVTGLGAYDARTFTITGFTVTGATPTLIKDEYGLITGCTFTMPATAVTVKPEVRLAQPAEITKEQTAKNEKQSIATTEKALAQLTKKNDADAKDPFNMLQARVNAKKAKGTQLEVNWTPNKSIKSKVNKYLLYGNYCGKKYTYEPIKTFGKSTKKFLLKNKVKMSNGKILQMKKDKSYKFIVIALGTDGKILATSKTVHAYTPGNSSYVKSAKFAKKSVKVSLKKNKKGLKIKFTIEPSKSKKGLIQHRAAKFELENAKLATVSMTTKAKTIKKKTAYTVTIKPKKAGTTKLWGYACDGTNQCITVKVTK